ncbi:hypothetical protein DL96DRAFT_1614806 [Flagelloscypha sp. PMI_526]|nr:hypothetical protein DL96DRAFT_1614806 [Flagelloscypha sp. PMI_526]
MSTATVGAYSSYRKPAFESCVRFSSNSYLKTHIIFLDVLSVLHSLIMVFAYTSYEFYLYTRLVQLLSIPFESFYPAQSPEWKDLSGKTVVVTGSNVGIGLEAARGLGERGATIVLACRNKEKAEAAKQDIVQNSKGKVKPEQVEVKVLDLSDLASVNKFVEEWGSRPLDILFNNAGVTVANYSQNPQGFEITYATNILSHYLLTLSLLPHIRVNGRIVNVSSDGHFGVDKQFDPVDLDHSNALKALGLKVGDALPDGGTMVLYSRSKCMQIIFTKELQERLNNSDIYKSKNITIHCYHPGLVRSTIWDRPDNMSVSPTLKSIILGVANTLGIPTTEGAATGIHLAVSEDAAKKPGYYWWRKSVVGPNPVVQNTEVNRLVFDQLAVECGLKEALKISH